MDAECLARLFHETYERLALRYGYETRPDSAVPWERVPEKNRRLMVAVAETVLRVLEPVDDWLPTAESINALPEPLRKFIHGLETNADPAGMVAGNTLLSDQVGQLQAALARRKCKCNCHYESKQCCSDCASEERIPGHHPRTVEQLHATIRRLKIDRDTYRRRNAVAQKVAVAERAEKKKVQAKLDDAHRELARLRTQGVQ